MQFISVFIYFTRCLGLVALMFLLGCQEDKTIAPALIPQASQNIVLPTRFDESLERAFQANPEQTAQRILRAHDGFSRVGPVTPQSVKNYLRLEASTDRANIMADILAIDLNGDEVITRAEYGVLSKLPNGFKKSARLDDLFAYDENLDGYISLNEAFDFAEHMAAARARRDLRPIGSYLMLFDLNGDGTVLRPEVVKALRDYLTAFQNAEPSLKRKPSLR